MAVKNSPVNILFLEQTSELGGVEVTTLATVSNLNRAAFAPVVMCPEPGELTKRLDSIGIPVVYLARPRAFSVTSRIGKVLFPNPFALVLNAILLIFSAVRLGFYLKSHPTDVIVTKGLLSHFLGGFACLLLGIPCVWHVQEVVNATHLFGFYRFILNLGARLCATLIIVDAVSVGAQFTLRLRNAGTVQLLYNGIDTQKYAPTGDAAPFLAGEPGDRLLIGQIGRIVPLKGQHVLIEAFAQLADRHPNASLIIIGKPMFDSDAYLKRLETLVRAQALEQRVQFAGFRSDIPEVLRALSILVHPSVEADSPVTVQEAMAAQLAVIASDVQGTVELLRDGHDGLLFQSANAADLSAKLAHLLENPAERARLAKHARETACERYGMSAYIARFETLIQSVVKR